MSRFILCALVATVFVGCNQDDSSDTHPNNEDYGSHAGADSGGESAIAGSVGGSNGGSGVTAGGTGDGGSSVSVVGTGGDQNGAGGSVATGGSETGTAGDDAGVAGSESGSDGSMSNECPGAEPAPEGYPTCRSDDECRALGEEYLCDPEPAFDCDHIPPQPSCFGDGDCSNGEICHFATPTGCDGPVNHCAPPCSTEECGPDEECGFGGRCQPKGCRDGYTCPSDSICDPSRIPTDEHGCAPTSCSKDDYECPEGYECNPALGRDVHGCADVSCAKGYECPPNTDCHPDSTSLHACDPRPCATDSDCDCGVCIQGYCYAHLFVCWKPPS